MRETQFLTTFIDDMFMYFPTVPCKLEKNLGQFENLVFVIMGS